MPLTPTPNMDLVRPEVGVDQDPTWGTLDNAAFLVVDSHDHTDGKGVLIPTAGIDLDADLTLNQFNLTDTRSVSFRNGVAVLPAGDINAIYVKSGDLWYNDADGTAVQITDGAALNLGAVAINVFATQDITSNTTITAADTYTLLLVDCSLIAKTIILPLANTVTRGRYYVVKDATSSATANNITISPQGADVIDNLSTSKTINTANGSMWFISDGTSEWFTIGHAGATATIPGLISLAGDLSGTAAFPVVGSIRSVSTPLTTPAIGNVIQADSTTSLVYGAINLAGGSNYVTGLLPGANLDATDLTSSDGTVDIATDALRIGAGLVIDNDTISGTYVVDDRDIILLVNTGGAVTITLPVPAVGRVLIIKDVVGTASTNNITLTPQATKKIDNLAGSRILSADYGSWTIMADSSGNWWTI